MAEGRIPEHKVDEVRLAANIAEVVGRRVKLTPAGKSLKGLCPFHGDSDPSLIVNRERGTWHCFGCGEGGNVFTFVMKDEGLTFPEAVKELARRYGVRLPKPQLTPAQKRQDQERQRLLRVMELAGIFFSEQLAAPAGAAARRYLADQRGLSPQVVAEFGLGYAPDSWEALRRHLGGKGVPEELALQTGLLVPRDKGDGCYDRFRGRVMFPIADAAGRLVSFGGRVLGGGEPKYLNGPETPLFNKSATLYNLPRARRHMRAKDRALVVEGYFDVITLAAMGLGETVAPMGTALTSQQVRRLKGQASNLVLVFDGDDAGRRAARRSLPLCLAEGVSPAVLLLPQGHDPDTFARERGASGMEEALAQARPLLEVVLGQVMAEGDRSTPEGKSKIVAEAGSVLRAIQDPVVSSEYLKHLARGLGLAPEVVAARLGLPAPGSRRAPARPRPAPRPAPAHGESQWQEVVLQTALAHPQAAQVLAEEGLLAELPQEDLAAVGRAICAQLEAGGQPDPAGVMNHLEDPELHKVVSRLAEAAPAWPADQAAGHARDLAAQHRRRLLGQQLKEISRELDQADQAGDADQRAVLQARRRLLREQLKSCLPQGKD
ncbi:MAG: DNA primase [Thermodesulfobacteriota bacterium]